MLSTAVYLGMGWLAIVALRPLLLNVRTAGHCVAGRGRVVLYAGCFVLRQRRAAPVSPRGVAFVRARGQHGAFLRSSMVCGSFDETLNCSLLTPRW